MEPLDVALKTGLFFMGFTIIGQILLMIVVAKGWNTTSDGETFTLSMAAGVGYSSALALVHLFHGGAMSEFTLLMFLVYFVLGTAASEWFFRMAADCAPNPLKA